MPAIRRIVHLAAMKTQVSLLLVCMLSSGALSLKCQPPTGINYTSGQLFYTECDYKCARTTTSVDIYLVSGVSTLTFSTMDYAFFCGSPEQCANTSINVGMVKIANNTQCCNTHLCNNQTLPVMPQQPINGQRCYTCNENDCSQKLHCEGEEDRCLSAKVIRGPSVMNLRGCTSRNICNRTLLRAHGLFITDVQCCQGDLCNAAESFTVRFLLMFLPLLTSILSY